MKIEQNIPLAPYTTLRVGGPARYFASAVSEHELRNGLLWARERSLPIFALGGGSNLLVSDRGFDGLVLRLALDGVAVSDAAAGGAAGKRIYSAAAGVVWDALVARAVEEGCAGLECLSGIPGSVGGTPVQNVGAYGQDVSETIVRVRGIDARSLEPVEFGVGDCGFSYRKSRFNSGDRGRYLLTRVDYALQAGGAPRIAYAELERRFRGPAIAPSLGQVREAVLEIRRAKGMVLDDNDEDSRSAGSFFKNPVVSLPEYERMAAAAPTSIPHFPAGEGQVKLGAAWLIEQAGITKGFALGPAAISRKHTLALVNRGGATAADIVRLKEFVEQRVRERWGLELQPEPVMLGFD
jgi:UDP-N-acetylmuramate dehydrogenase